MSEANVGQLDALVGQNNIQLADMIESWRAKNKWGVVLYRNVQIGNTIESTESVIDSDLSWKAANQMADLLQAEYQKANPKATCWTMDFYQVKLMANTDLSGAASSSRSKDLLGKGEP